MIEKSISKERLFFLAEQALRITLEESLEPENEPIPEHIRNKLHQVEVSLKGTTGAGMSLRYSPKLGRAFSEKLNCYSDIQPLEERVRTSMKLLGKQIAKDLRNSMLTAVNDSEEGPAKSKHSLTQKLEKKNYNTKPVREVASMCDGEPFIISLFS